MPEALSDIVRSGPGSSLGGIAADDVVPGVGLEISHSSGEEPGCDEVEEAGRDNEEVLQLSRASAPSTLA